MPITLPANLRHALRFVLHIRQRYQEDGCANSAAALTYMSLFALVPLMTVMYAVLSMAPAFQNAGDQLEQILFQHLVPTSGQEIHGYLQHFAQQARKLSGAGVLVLMVTAVMMLRNIERTLNNIWGVTEGRRGISSFLLYWAVLSLGPVLIGVGLAITGYITSLRAFSATVEALGLGQQLLSYLPLFLSASALTLLFAAVPNCPVQLRHAAAGGLLTALCFETAKRGFAMLVANTSYQAIYGAFAAIPLFLLWIYLSWLIVLAGAQLVHALSDYQGPHSAHHTPLQIALLTLARLQTAQQKGQICTEKQLRRLPGESRLLPWRQWRVVRDRLMSNGYLRQGQREEILLVQDLRLRTTQALIELFHPLANPEDLQPCHPLLTQHLQEGNRLWQEQLQTPIHDWLGDHDETGRPR